MTTDATTVATPSPAQIAGRRFGLLLQTNLLLYLRNRMAVFWNMVFPIGLMLLFGAIYGREPAVITYLATGMVVLSLLSNGLIGNAATMALWRERGILRRIQTTPLPLWQLLLARIVTQGAIMILQACLLIGTSVLVFGAQFELGNLVAAIPAVVLGALLFMAFGQALAALVQKVDTVNIIGQVIYFPLMFLGNIFLPLQQLPDALQTVGKWFPSAMIADLVRTTMLGQSAADMTLPLPVTLLGVACYFAAAVVIAVRFFKWR
ncbi:MAG TPA: ABC transporter permease [Chloroflexia bacterium]|jgi:ABC-2 type transport system permease protein|nr:ABC transporter permease [Chloroflexia bacterium]